MFTTVLKSEYKNILRDKMTVFMLFYPILIGAFGKWLIPYINTNYPGNSANSAELIIIILTLMLSFIYGALAGFSILDDRDDKVFTSLKISPISVKTYVWIKILISFIIGVTATFLVVRFADLLPMVGDFDLLLISLLSGLQIPFVAMLVNSLATNKIEGFVYMKASGFLLLFPIGSFFFVDWKEWLFAIAPGFWPARVIQMNVLPILEYNLSLNSYLILGFAYNIFAIFLMYKFFVRKNNL